MSTCHRFSYRIQVIYISIQLLTHTHIYFIYFSYSYTLDYNVSVIPSIFLKVSLLKVCFSDNIIMQLLTAFLDFKMTNPNEKLSDIKNIFFLAFLFVNKLHCVE